MIPGDATSASVYTMYAVMALFATAALYFLVNAVRTGAVADDEAPKYRMLEDDLPAPATKGRQATGWNEGGSSVQET